MCDINKRIKYKKTYIASITTWLQRIAFGGKYLPVSDLSKAMSFFKRLLSSGTDRDKRGDSYMYTSSDHQLGKAFAGRLSSDDVPDEDNGSDKSQNIDFKLLIDRSIKRLSHRYFETDAHKRCLTYRNRQVITRIKRGTDRENAECEQYLFNLFHDDIPYMLGAFRAVKNLEVKDPYSHTSASKTAPVSVVGQSFSVDQNAISRRGSQNVEYQLEEKEKTIRILQRRYDEIAKSVDSSISTRYKTERNALLEEVEKFENAVNHCLQSYRLVLRKVTIINPDTNKVDFTSITTEIQNLAHLASSHGSSHRDDDLKAQIEVLENNLTTARIGLNVAQEETKRVKEENNNQALIIYKLSHENEEIRLEKQRLEQKATGSNASLLAGMNQIKVDYAKEKRETINEIDRLNATIGQLSLQLEGAMSELRATKSSNKTLQNEIRQMKIQFERKQQSMNIQAESSGQALNNQRKLERDNQSIGNPKITDFERRLEEALNKYASLQMGMRQLTDRHEEEKNVMTLEINSLNSTIKQMQAERVSEKKDVEELERQFNSARLNISVKTNANTALQTEMQQMKSQFENIQREMQELQRRVDGHQMVEQDSKSQWERQNDDLKRQLQIVKDSNASLQNSKHQLEVDYAKEKDRTSRHTNSLQTTIRCLQSDVDDRASTIKGLERELEDARKEIDSITITNTALKNEMRQMKNQSEEKERNMVQEIEGLKQATHDQRGIEQDKLLAIQKIKELESQVAVMQNTNKSLQIDLKQAESNYAREKGERASDINRLNATIKRLQDGGVSRMAETKHIEELEQQIESAKRDLSTASDTNTTLQHKMQHMKSQSEAKEQRMANEIENLKRNLEDQRQLGNDSVAKGNQMIVALERQLETEKQAKASIQNEMRQIESRQAKDKEEINRLNAIIKGMQAEELKTKKKHTKELERHLESSRREIGAMQNANTNLQQHIHQIKSQSKEKEKTLTRGIEQLRQTVNNHDQVEQDSNTQWTQRVHGLERQLEKQNSTNASLERRMRQLEEEKQGLTREVNRLNVIIKDLQAEKVNRMAGEKRITELERKLEIIKSDLKAKAHENASLKRQLV